MLNTLLHSLIARQERTFGVPLDYLRQLVRTSRSALFKLALLAPAADHRVTLPRTAFHVARLAATRAEDCGACLQIAAHYARRAGLERDLIVAVLRGEPDRLPEDLRDVLGFATSIASGGDDPELRARLASRYGETGLVELGLVIATARVLPAYKRAVGHATSCRLIDVAASPGLRA